MMHARATPPDDAAKLDSDCKRAMEHQLAGRLDLAGQLYGAILRAAPNHAAANYCLGMLHVQAQRVTDGLPHLKAALQARLDVVDYWLGYLEALMLAGQTAAARNILALGTRQGIAGKAVDEFAERLLRHAERSPTPPAVAASPKKSAQRPRDEREILEQESLLLSLVERHENAAALELARDLTEWFPERGVGWKILGALMAVRDGREKAIDILRTAVHLMPEDAEAHINLGLTLAQTQRAGEAEIHLLKAIDLDPTSSAAHFRLAMTYELQGRNAEAEASLRRGRALSLGARNVAGDDMLSYSHLLFIMGHSSEHDADELHAEHLRFGRHVEGPLRAGWPRHANQRDPERRIKVGFVSGDLHDHSVGHFLEPVLAHLAARPDLELLGYCTNTREDPVSRRLRTHFKCFASIDTLPDGSLEARIIDDRVDVLIDLSGHTGYNRLPVFARKPAPVQVSWLGYPGTTGLEAMDYYLADPCWLPPGRFDSMFTEKLVYLPDRWAFIPHPSAPAVAPLPALSKGRMTFGSFHRLGKINAETVRLWSRLLLAVPGSTLLLVGIRLGGEESRLVDQFAAHGVAPERLELQERNTMERYLAFHNRVDIALDTLAYSGATTTMHSLSMGVPTLTVPGGTPQGRACAGILAHLELDSFIAVDTDDFLVKGRYWAAHPADLAALRSQLRRRLRQSPGGDSALIAEHVHRSLRHVWRRWCQGLPAASFHSSTTLVAAPPLAVRNAAEDVDRAVVARHHPDCSDEAIAQLLNQVITANPPNDDAPPHLDLSAFERTIDTLLEQRRFGDILEIIFKSVKIIKLRPEFIGRKIYTPYFDAILESIDLDIDPIVSNEEKIANVVIASELYASGGHTKVIAELLDALENPILVVTDIYDRFSQSNLFAAIAPTFPSCPVLLLPRESYLKKAVRLAGFINTCAKHVFLVSHHEDAAAVVACQSTLDTRYYFIHHADHNPSLGGHVRHFQHVDLFADIAKLCEHDLDRGVNVLPIHAADMGPKLFNHPIERFSTVSAGTSNKFNFSGAVNLPELIVSAIETCGGNHYHFGALSDEQLQLIHAHLAQASIARESFIYLGNVPSLWAGLLSIDAHIYIGSFPMRGGKGEIEAQGASLPLMIYEHPDDPRYLNVARCNPLTEHWHDRDRFCDGLRRIMLTHRECSSESRAFYLAHHTETAYAAALHELTPRT